MMAKIQNLSELSQSFSFTEYDFFDFYRRSFERSELGRIKKLLWECCERAYKAMCEASGRLRHPPSPDQIPGRGEGEPGVREVQQHLGGRDIVYRETVIQRLQRGDAFAALRQDAQAPVRGGCEEDRRRGCWSSNGQRLRSQVPRRVPRRSPHSRASD